MTSSDETDDAPTEVTTPTTTPVEALTPRGSAMTSSGSPGRRQRIRNALRASLASYRVRIVAWFVVLLTLGTLATIFVVGQLLFQRIDEGIRADLVQEVEEFRSLTGGTDPETGQPFGTDVRRMFDVFLGRNIPNRYEVLLTFVDGALYARSAAPPPYPIDQDPDFVAAVAQISATAGGRLDTSVGVVEYLAVPVRAEDRTLGVFASAGFPDLARAEQQEIVLGALFVGIALLLIGSLLAWRLADRLLAPVGQTAATARSISETDLSQRVEVSGYDEMADLSRTFNDMLDRLESAFAGQRRFLDDVGHELRTPLTIVRGHLELIDEVSAEERENTRELVLDEVDRMARLVDDLIMLARADQPDFLRREDIQAGDLVRRVHEKVVVLGEREWQLRIERDGWLSCDAQRVSQALTQLAANAVGHTVDGGRIELGLDVGAIEAIFWVQDDGPGVPPDERDRLFERFYRGAGQARSGGSGLGLSIVRAIVEAHGGRALIENGPAGGARFSLVLPRTASVVSLP